jgi:hypothetical protein
MKRILSLFDYSGEWPYYFQKSGWDVLMIDIKDGHDVNYWDSCETLYQEMDDINAIIAAVPCTDFANSGARWFAEKDADGRTCASVELCYQTLRIVSAWEPTCPDFIEECENGEPYTWFWAVENPVGRIQKLVPELGPAYYFQPHEFAGYLDLSDADHNELDRLRRKDGKGFTPEERQFVIDCNAYTKKTGLWGCFNRSMEKRPIEPVRCNNYGSPMMSLGGNTAKTKEIRSNTPEGFSRAFFHANEDWNPWVAEVGSQLEIF